MSLFRLWLLVLYTGLLKPVLVLGVEEVLTTAMVVVSLMGPDSSTRQSGLKITVFVECMEVLMATA